MFLSLSSVRQTSDFWTASISKEKGAVKNVSSKELSLDHSLRCAVISDWGRFVVGACFQYFSQIAC